LPSDPISTSRWCFYYPPQTTITHVFKSDESVSEERIRPEYVGSNEDCGLNCSNNKLIAYGETVAQPCCTRESSSANNDHQAKAKHMRNFTAIKSEPLSPQLLNEKVATNAICSKKEDHLQSNDSPHHETVENGNRDCSRDSFPGKDDTADSQKTVASIMTFPSSVNEDVPMELWDQKDWETWDTVHL
jgi:hypothetical protein